MHEKTTMITINTQQEFFIRLNHLQSQLRELDPCLNWSNFMSPNGFAAYATGNGDPVDSFTAEQRSQLFAIAQQLNDLASDATSLLDFCTRQKSPLL